MTVVFLGDASNSKHVSAIEMQLFDGSAFDGSQAITSAVKNNCFPLATFPASTTSPLCMFNGCRVVMVFFGAFARQNCEQPSHGIEDGLGTFSRDFACCGYHCF